MEQERGRVLDGQFFEFDRVDDAEVLEVLGPRGDEDVPVLGVGEERLEQGGVVGVVENQEPSGFGLQPLLEGEDGLVQVVLGMRQAAVSRASSQQPVFRLRVDSALSQRTAWYLSR